MKEGMAVNLNSHVLLTGGYQDFVGPVDEVDICMDREHGKQDKQRKKDYFPFGGKITFQPNTHFLQIFEFNFDNQSWDLVSCKFSAI